MKIMVVGGGAIGLFVAASLRQKEMDITVCTRTEAQAKQLSSEGLTLKTNKTNITYEIKAAAIEQAAIEQADILIVTVKAHSLSGLFENIKFRLKAKQILLFLQNGMSHIEIAEKLTQQSVAIGTMSHGAIRESATVVKHTGVGELKWATFTDSGDVLNSFMNGLNQPDFLVKKEPDWHLLMWSKLLANICINPLTALIDCPNGALLESNELKNMMRQVFEEAMLFHPYPENAERYWQQVVTICKQTSENHSSMLVDFRNQRNTELDSIVGYIYKKAHIEGIDIPLITFLYQVLKEKERHNICGSID